LVEFIESGREWREGPDTVALVAEDEGAVAGYLEASLRRPDVTARWQGDLSDIRLFINFVGTADEDKRQGVRYEARRSGGTVGTRPGRGRRSVRHVHR
jgi:hypothetical protein